MPKAGIENMNVYINFWSPLNLLNIRRSFVTLITLKILAIWGRIDMADELDVLDPVYYRIMSKILAITTKKSNKFQPDKK